MEWPTRQNGSPARPKTGGSSSHNDGGPTGTITLAHTGLITRVDRKAADLLGTRQGEIQGKPFTLFVERAELAVFFSHWNKLLSTFKNQLFEITLKGAAHKTRLECSTTRGPSGKIKAIQIVLAGRSDQPPATEPPVQPAQDLPALIFAISSGIGAADAKHLDRSIEDALGRIGLFAEADHCFIHTLNRSSKRLDPACEWRRQPQSGKHPAAGSKSIPLSKVRRIMSRLRRDRIMTFHDAAQLDPVERNELPAWPGGGTGAGIFYFICPSSVPVGVVGVTRKAARSRWSEECESLVRFFGDFMAGRLLSQAHITSPADPRRGDRPASGSPTAGAPERPGIIGGFKQKSAPPQIRRSQWETDLDAPQTWSKAPAVERSMTFEPSDDDKADIHLPVLPGDDRQVILSCPDCGKQKPVPLKQLTALGSAISATCPCARRFTILFDRRKVPRRTVRLEAIVTRVGDAASIADRPRKLGWMVIKDLSREGLRLASVNARHLNPGDLLMVQFNLDNSSRTLIEKLARVASINGDEVGCRFEVIDRHDITLGFYLM